MEKEERTEGRPEGFEEGEKFEGRKTEAAEAKGVGKEVRKGDLVLINYIGMYENGEVFDTSYEDVARKNGILVEGRTYAPMKLTAGGGEVIPGIDKALIGMRVGEKKVVEVPPEKGYGMPRPELVIEISTDEFSKAGIKPIKGMYVATDSGLAKVLDVTEKTVKLDFNHPLAGRTTRFEIEVVSIEERGTDEGGLGTD